MQTADAAPTADPFAPPIDFDAPQDAPTESKTAATPPAAGKTDEPTPEQDAAADTSEGEENDEQEPGDKEASEAGRTLARRSPQARINKAVAQQREAERQLEAERAERARLQAEIDALKKGKTATAEGDQPPAEPEAEPEYTKYVKSFGKTPEDFPDYDAYTAALTVHTQKELLKERDASEAASRQQQDRDRAATELVAKHASRVDAFKQAHADYDDVLANPDVPATPAMVGLIYESELGPALAYHLATHVDEAARIAQLPVAQQIKEMGRLEARLEAAQSSPAPATPVKSNAPAPMPRVGGGAVATEKSLQELADEGDVDSWLEKRNAQASKQRGR